MNEIQTILETMNTRINTAKGLLRYYENAFKELDHILKEYEEQLRLLEKRLDLYL